MRSNDPSPLASGERELLDGLLAYDFLGVEAPRVQAREVDAKKGCACGCGTIALVPRGTALPQSQAVSPAPAEGRVVDAEGNEVGGLLLFIKDGLLDSLEVYSYDKPLSLPTIDRVRWEFVSR